MQSASAAQCGHWLPMHGHLRHFGAEHVLQLSRNTVANFWGQGGQGWGTCAARPRLDAGQVGGCFVGARVGGLVSPESPHLRAGCALAAHVHRHAVRKRMRQSAQQGEGCRFEARAKQNPRLCTWRRQCAHLRAGCVFELVRDAARFHVKTDELTLRVLDNST